MVNPKEDMIKIPFITKQGDLYENVTEITGTAIPAYYEHLTQEKMTIFEKLKLERIKKLKEKETGDENRYNGYMFVDEGGNNDNKDNSNNNSLWICDLRV